MRARRTRRDLAWRVRVYSDPLQHAAIAAAVVAPLVGWAGRRVFATAAAAALAIDADHVIAARSVRTHRLTGLAQRPRTHSLLAAGTAGTLVGAAAGPAHGWAAFAALASHLLHDAGDRAAPTPVLWPFRPARQLGRRVQLAGTVALTSASALIAWAAARASAPAGGGAAGAGAADPRRTASSRS